jgi:hypothetical protein
MNYVDSYLSVWDICSQNQLHCHPSLNSLPWVGYCYKLVVGSLSLWRQG